MNPRLWPVEAVVLLAIYFYETFLWSSMAKKVAPKQVPQHTSSHYLQKIRLQERLEALFPGQKEFTIRVAPISPAHRVSN